MNQEYQKNIIREIHSLPTLPTTFTHISRLIRNPTTSAIDIANVIRQDQALTARLLKMVNSAFYGFPSKIRTVSHAIVVLGFQSIKNLVLSCSVMDQFKSREQSALFDQALFWEHALATAMGSRLIAKACHYSDPEEGFVAGLLHDIGKLVHDQYLHARFVQALETARSSRVTIYEAERITLGMTHAETGYLLAEQWKLPDDLMEAIGMHHTPELAKRNPLLTSIVHVADVLCRALEIGNPGDPFVPRLSDIAWKNCNLPVKQIDAVMRQMAVEAMEIKAFLSLTAQSAS